MDESSLATQELATSQQRGISSSAGELWEELRLEAVRVAAREEILRGFLDVAVLRPANFALGLGHCWPESLGSSPCRSSGLETSCSRPWPTSQRSSPRQPPISSLSEHVILRRRAI